MSYIKRQYLIKTKGHLGYHIMNLKINSIYEITNIDWFQQLDQNSLLAIWTTFLTPPPDTRILWPPDVRRDKQLTKLQTNKIWLVSIKYRQLPVFWFGHKDDLAKSLNAESILIFCHYMITLSMLIHIYMYILPVKVKYKI